MGPAENNKAMPEKKSRKKKALKIAAGIVIFLILLLVLVAAIAVPAYVSSESGRRFILAKANASGTGAVDFANLSMGWVKGISISRLSFKDNANSVSVAVKGFSTRPNYGAILTGSLSFGETVIDEPRVEIDVDKMKQGTEDRGQKTENRKQKTEKGLPIGQIDLVVKDGDVKIKGASGAVEVSQINSKVNLRPENQRTNFEVAASIADGGVASTINAKGGVTPGKNWALKGTSGDLTIEVNNLDISSLESILAIAGIEASAKGVVSANLKAVMKNGVIENVSGDVKGEGLEITAPQLKGDKIKSSVLDAAVEVHQQGDLINVEKLSVRTDWLTAEANGIMPMNAGSVREFMKADSKYELKANLECDIPAVAAQLPKTLGIKEQTRVTAGKLVGSVQTLSEGGQKKLAGQVSIDGLAGMVEGKPIVLSEPISAQAKIAAEGEQVKFEKAGVTSAFATANCAGTLEAFDYDVRLDLFLGLVLAKAKQLVLLLV
jgi:translocation and assembly module TamB